MSKKKIISILSILILFGFIGFKYFKKHTDSKKDNVPAEAKSKFYWTCPMHPQIHKDHPGECPICHMKLVKVEQQEESKKSDSSDLSLRSSVYISKLQSSLIGIQKVEVEKMDLQAKLPISGRLISSSSIAMQIYEDDLRYVKSGLKFQGEAGANSEEEISGIISSVDSLADPTSRTVRVVGFIKKGPKNLLPETSFRGDIIIELPDRIAIPESSVLHTGSGSLVYIFDEMGKLHPKKVHLGLKTGSFYEVLHGLEPGDIISSGPNFLIDSEAKIRGVGATNDHQGH